MLPPNAIERAKQSGTKSAEQGEQHAGSVAHVHPVHPPQTQDSDQAQQQLERVNSTPAQHRLNQGDKHRDGGHYSQSQRDGRCLDGRKKCDPVHRNKQARGRDPQPDPARDLGAHRTPAQCHPNIQASSANERAPKHQWHRRKRNQLAQNARKAKHHHGGVQRDLGAQGVHGFSASPAQNRDTPDAAIAACQLKCIPTGLQAGGRKLQAVHGSQGPAFPTVSSRSVYQHPLGHRYF